MLSDSSAGAEPTAPSRFPAIAVDRSTWSAIRGRPGAELVDLVLDDPAPAEVDVGLRRFVPVVDVRSELPADDPARAADLVVAALQVPAGSEVVLLTDDPRAAREALDVVDTLRREAAGCGPPEGRRSDGAGVGPEDPRAGPAAAGDGSGS